MKSETIKIATTTNGLPYPKLMIAKCSKTIILATTSTSEHIKGTVVNQCGWAIGYYSDTWNSAEFHDLPLNEVVQLSNN